MNSLSGVAGRYAKALFELAEESAQLDAVGADLGALRNLLSESPELNRLVTSPLFTREEQARGINAVLEAAGASDLVRRFMGVVAENRRLFALRDMITSFTRLLADARGEMTASVTAARPLSDAQRQQLAATLKQAIGRDVSIEEDVDTNLLGGLIVRVGSRMIDSSLNSKLNALRTAMKGVG